MSGKEIVARGKDGMCYANKKYLGVHLQDCLGTTDIRIAKEVLRDLMAEVRSGRYQLWKQFFNEEWVLRYESTLIHFSDSKRERFEGILEKHVKPFFENRRMGEVLTLDDHNDPKFIPLFVQYKLFREAKGTPESTLRKELQVVRDIIRLAKRDFPFPNARTEPLMKMKNKGKVKTDVLDYGTVLDLAEAVYCKYRLPWLMSCYTGLDLKDACGLIVDDFREPGWIKDSRGKTDNPFYVPIHRVLQEEVLDHIPGLPSKKAKIVSITKVDREQPIFPGSCPRAMANAIIRAAEKLGLRGGKEESRVSSKWGRHFYATTLAEVEDDENLIGMALGHKRKSITRLYIHRNKPRLFKLAEDAFAKVRCANGVQFTNAVKQVGSK